MRNFFRVFGGLFGRSRELRRRGFKPSLELLERRDTPSVFIWRPAAAHWENGASWDGTPGVPNDWPGWDGTALTTNDIANIGGANSTVTMVNSHELASIDLNATFGGTLTLLATLTLNNGGTMSNGTIVQRPAGGTTNGTITLTFGTFTWTGGSINYSTAVNTTPSTFTIIGPATLSVGGGANLNLGSDLYIQEGVLNLNNTGNITVRNRPTITNSGGDIDVTSFGSLTYDGDKIPINNEGIIKKTAGGTSYDIGMPVINNLGSIIAQDGELRFSATNPATGNTIDQSGGTIRLEGGNLAAVIYQDAGEIWAVASGTSIIAGRVTVNGGNVTIGTVTSPAAQLRIQGDFWFQLGTIQYHYDTVAGVGGVLRALVGSIFINPDTTAMEVLFLGMGQLPASFRVMTATGTIDSQVGIVPAGYFSDLSVPGEYWLTRRA